MSNSDFFLKVLLLIPTIILSFWIIVFLFFNDFLIPSQSLKKYKKILVIFPHPDDEVLSAGGVMASNGNATLLLLTKGERGNPDGHLDNSLKGIRTKEAQEAARILHVKKLIQKDFGDGELIEKPDEIKKELVRTLKEEKPDLVITYDQSGLYGHPDHMIVSQIVTELIKKDFSSTELWYTTVPKRVYRMISLPEHMANDKNFKEKRTYPTLKVFIGGNIINKIQAVKAHRSQHKGFDNGMPLHIPSPFFHSVTMWEYFYKVD